MFSPLAVRQPTRIIEADQGSLFAKYLSYMMKMLITPVIVLICLVQASICNINNTEADAHYDAHAQIIEDLFHATDYKSHTFPHDLLVSMELLLLKIVDIDPLHHISHFDGIFTQIWTDNRLILNPDDYGGIQAVSVDPQLSYRTDIGVYEGTMETRGDARTKVFLQSGLVIWSQLTRFGAYCDFPPLPSDNVTCKLVLGSWSHDTSEVDIVLAPENSIEHYHSPGACSLVSSSAVRNSRTYDCCPDTEYADITFDYRLNCNNPNGEPEPIKLTTISVPVVLSSFFILAVFLLPPTKGERIIFCALVSLLEVAQMLAFDLTENQALFLQLTMVYNVFAAFAALVSVNMMSMQLPDAEKDDDKDDTKKKYLKARLVDLLLCGVFALVLILTVIITFAR